MSHRYNADVLRVARYVRSDKKLTVATEEGFCIVCGTFGAFRFAPVINATLAKQWRMKALDRQAMSARESMYCGYCGSTFRLRQLSRALALVVSDKENGLIPLVELVKNSPLTHMKIAEINSCGMLHDYLKLLPYLMYSEFGSKNPKIRNENLLQLSYNDNMFDIILTSDSIEHVPDVHKAFCEVYRVLKPGGWHIFTIPVIWGRDTVVRTRLDGEKIVHPRTKSFHGSGEEDYLVWTEFGDTVVGDLENTGFEVSVFFLNTSNIYDSTAVFVARKPGAGTSPMFPLEDEVFKNGARCKYEHEYLWDESRQYARDFQLQKKQQLTQAHVENLETVSKGHIAYIRKLEKDIKTLQHEIAELRQPAIKKTTKTA